MGACIGSFLNVVIYRMPRGLSVNNPKRSFCPECKSPIPMTLNLPVISWLYLRGKCRDCAAPIPFRYIGVEILTAVLFAAIWHQFAPLAPQVIPCLWILAALLVAITFIDAEHLIIPTSLTWAGSLIGLVGCLAWPQLSVMAGAAASRTNGLIHAAVGWLVGFLGLWLVVELGKRCFGKKTLRFDEPVPWRLQEPETEEDPMCFVMGDEAIPWWDMFTRKSDRLLVDCTDIEVDGSSVGSGTLQIGEYDIILPDGTKHRLAILKSLSGSAASAVVPREAMGMGDVHLMGMIGAFFGVGGVFFSLFAASLFAIFAAVIGRIGFGRQLPFGPFLAMGAGFWMFGGWRLWVWYLDLLGPLGMP